jgi:hypothetical protein
LIAFSLAVGRIQVFIQDITAIDNLLNKILYKIVSKPQVERIEISKTFNHL